MSDYAFLGVSPALMKHQRILLVALCLGFAAAGALVMHLVQQGERSLDALEGQSKPKVSGRDEGDLAAVEDDPRAEPDEDPAPVRAPDGGSTEDLAEVGMPMRSIQADVYGPHWPEIEAYLVEIGRDAFLDRVVEPENVPIPWHEVEDQLKERLAEAIEKERRLIPIKLEARDRLAWPDPPTKDFLVDQADIGVEDEDFDEDDLERALAKTHYLREEVLQKERALIDAYHQGCLDYLRAGRYEKATLFFYDSNMLEILADPALKGEPRWGATTVNCHTWTVSFSLYKNEYPGIQRMAEELRSPYRQLDSAMRKALLQDY